MCSCGKLQWLIYDEYLGKNGGHHPPPIIPPPSTYVPPAVVTSEMLTVRLTSLSRMESSTAQMVTVASPSDTL